MKESGCRQATLVSKEEEELPLSSCELVTCYYAFRPSCFSP